jgi:hypothetical protein
LRGVVACPVGNAWAFKLGAAALLFLTVTPSVRAATFEVLRLPGYDDVIIMMTGEVTAGDAQRFDDTVSTLGGAHTTLNVSGPGGLVSEALDIGAQVQERRIATMISAQAECYSACALIWLAGPRRYLAPDSVIGVHAAFRTREGETPQDSGVGNARIGAFLNMIGLPLDAISYITTVPPDDFLPITPAIARNLGIEVYEQHGIETATPDTAPTAHVLATQTAELAPISTQCSELLQLDPAMVRQAMEITLGKAHEDYGGERMGEIISWMPSEVRADFEHDGFAKWCFEAAPRLREEGLSFGFDGTSFDCSRASSATEHLLCDDPTLWGPDRAISALYSVYRERAAADLRVRLRDAQRSWIAWRDGCGADLGCVTEAYRQRLKDFGLERG